MLDYRMLGSSRPYVDLITKILMHCDVILEGEEHKTSKSKISLPIINQTKVLKRVKGFLYIPHTSNAPVDQNPQAPLTYQQPKQSNIEEFNDEVPQLLPSKAFLQAILASTQYNNI